MELMAERKILIMQNLRQGKRYNQGEHKRLGCALAQLSIKNGIIPALSLPHKQEGFARKREDDKKKSQTGEWLVEETYGRRQ